jgi:hypothetical protein
MIYMDDWKPSFKVLTLVGSKEDKINGNLFYRYQSLKVEKDNKGNDRIYTIENLANNQLHFSNAITFNDPFDCKFSLTHLGTREQWINDYKNQGYNHRKALKEFNKDVKAGYLIKKQENLYDGKIAEKISELVELGLARKEDFLVNNNPSQKRIGTDMNDYVRSVALPDVCCFSGNKKSILMWSHYADNHKGICLSFRSYKETLDVNKNIIREGLTSEGIYKEGYEYCLLNLYPSTTNKLMVHGIFHEISYKDDLPESVNFFDIGKTLNRFLVTKFTDWKYENEYRIMLPRLYLENGFAKYDKSSLEGVIFGLRTNYENAKLVYETVKKNYLDEGITVNFYEAKEIPRKYEVEIDPIQDMGKYLNGLR